MRITPAFLFLLFLFAIAGSYAQVRTPLRLDTSRIAFSGTSLFCDKNYSCGLGKNENYKMGFFDDEKIAISVRRLGSEFLVLIDTNRNGKLSDEKVILVRKGGKSRVLINKQLADRRSKYLPFELSHTAPEKKGEMDEFSISAHYAALGNFKNGACSVKIGLFDMDRNGKFELADSAGGTNFQIDSNNDGKFWGKAEFHSTNEIITFCGQNYLVSGLNNASVEFTRTDLKLARVDEPTPAFSFALLDGRPITDAALKGDVYVLDFWASWCVPCVENLPHIAELREQNKDRVQVYSINVDTARKRTSAEQIIKKYGISEFSVIRGLGDADPFWKTFGGADLNRLSIPLYVLVDKDGIVRYANNGGEELIGLKASIDKLFTK